MPIKTALTIGLSVIPPANRRPGVARTGGPRRTNETDEFRVRVVAPNPQAQQSQRQREIGGQALREEARQLVRLLEQAETAGERAHWERKLMSMLDFLGLGDLVKGLGLGGLTQGLGEVLKALGNH